MKRLVCAALLGGSILVPSCAALEETELDRELQRYSVLEASIQGVQASLKALSGSLQALSAGPPGWIYVGGLAVAAGVAAGIAARKQGAKKESANPAEPSRASSENRAGRRTGQEVPP